MWSDDCANNGLSLICVDESGGGGGGGGGGGADKVVGCLWLRDFSLPGPPNFEAVCARGCPTVRRLYNVLDEVDNKYMALRDSRGEPPLRAGQCCELWMGAVLPAYRRRGIMRCLIPLGIAHAHAHGFTSVVAECTGAYSLKACRRAGMRAVAEVVYARAQERLFRHTAAPHTAMVFVEHAVAHRGGECGCCGDRDSGSGSGSGSSGSGSSGGGSGGVDAASGTRDVSPGTAGSSERSACELSGGGVSAGAAASSVVRARARLSRQRWEVLGMAGVFAVAVVAATWGSRQKLR